MTLKRGWNAVLPKATKENGPWEFCFHICNPDGKKVRGTKVQAEPPAKQTGLSSLTQDAESRPRAARTRGTGPRAHTEGETMRIALALVAPALLLVLGGCFQAETIVKVKADGSGTIEETSSMSLEAIKMFKGQMDEMAKNMGGGAAGGQKEMFSAEQAKAKAANMGEGVEFVSCEPIKTPTHEGQKAVYRFADITKLKLDTQPAPQGGPAGGAAGGPAAGKQGGGDVITFKFAKQPGGNALVTAVFAEKKTPKQEEKKADDAAQEMQLAMMKQFMKGLKFSIAVVPDGTLVKTNSSYRDGSKVTLMEMDLDEVMKDEAAFKKLGATQNMSMPEASKALSGVAGIKIPSSSEVTIEFTGK